MLEPDVINCIRETIDAELLPRDAKVRFAIQASQRQLAARGLGRSGNALHEAARIGSDELSVRAEILWGIIQRCHGAFGGAPSGDAPLTEHLQQQVALHITVQAATVLELVDNRALSDSLPGDAKTFVPQAVRTRRDELIRKFSNEARLWAQTLRSAAAARSGQAPTINIHGNVGAVQTGAFASAHIHLDMAQGGRFVQALEQLQASIAQNAEMTAEQRTESSEVVTDMIAATRAPKPNGSKLAGLLKGLALSVETIASLRGAWDLVRDAARLIGIPLR